MHVIQCLGILERQWSNWFLNPALMSKTRRFVSKTVLSEPGSLGQITPKNKEEEELTWPKKIFSGIQPTGALHLGNYLGAVKKWRELQSNEASVTYCIVDMHSITVPQNPDTLQGNILCMAATMLACGINPEKATMFVQSDVKEHAELCWILNSLTTMARLGHLPQYREKTKAMKEVPLGLYTYPVLQAADIMLYKTTHVPVGEDQIQHIQLAQHLTKLFNGRFGPTFPVCHAVIEQKEISRIRSLRDPTKKMSKSDRDPKATIFVTDQPEDILEKVKKAVTDFQSEVSYEPEKRPGVSNLVAIHANVTGKSIADIVKNVKDVDTGKYKLQVAEAIIEHFKPIRENIKRQLTHPEELLHILQKGAERARLEAKETMNEVKHKMGLGLGYAALGFNQQRKPIGNDSIHSVFRTENQETRISSQSPQISSKFKADNINISDRKTNYAAIVMQKRSFVTHSSTATFPAAKLLHFSEAHKRRKAIILQSKHRTNICFTNCHSTNQKRDGNSITDDSCGNKSKGKTKSSDDVPKDFSKSIKYDKSSTSIDCSQNQRRHTRNNSLKILFAALILTCASYYLLIDYSTREILKKYFETKRTDA